MEFSPTKQKAESDARRSEEATIQVSEIFGPTIQGEGELIGLPTVFVRTGGCDFHCSWCDTLYAVEQRYREQWTAMTAEEVLDRVRQLSGGRPLMVSLSGGNPALQPLANLIALGKAAGYSFALETQGSVVKPWFSELDLLIISPKPPSSGMATDLAKLRSCLAAAGTARSIFKFVVFDDADYRFACNVAAKLPEVPVYLQPGNDRPAKKANEQNADPEALARRLRWLVERVVEDGWYQARVLPQLHVLLWGNRRGV